MHLVRSLDHLPLDLSHGSCLTIGNFDGVHLGHQALIRRVLLRAQERGLASAVVTFWPHPLQVLQGPDAPPALTDRQGKIDRIRDLGVDLLALLDFTMAVADMEPEDWVRSQLVERLALRHLVIGYDYSFGKYRRGDFALLEALGAAHGFQVERVEPLLSGGEIVSSTRIRDLLRAGQVWDVRPLLGRFHSVRGPVVHGQDRGGRLLGCPTANLPIEGLLLPLPGVYAAWACLGEGEPPLPAVANVGSNPTFGTGGLTVEAHLLDFGQRIYGESLTLSFVRRLRDEMTFSGPGELAAHIQEDIALARRILAEPQALP